MKSRRSFIRKMATAISLSTLAHTSWPKEATKVRADPLPNLKGRKILFVYGGWEGHEPGKFKDYLVPWMEDSEAMVEVYETVECYANEQLMDSIDLVVQIHTMSSIKKDEQKGLLTAIRKGCGIAGWHGGMCDAFRNNPPYQYMTGGQWVAHPGNVIDYNVRVTNPEDPITQGIDEFKMTSEQYYMHVDPNVKVLATTRFDGSHHEWIEGCTIPVVWKKNYGKGRIFYTSLGHSLSHITDQPAAVKILKRGIRWASASKYEPIEKCVEPMYPY